MRLVCAGVTKMMVTGTSLHSTKEALRLTRLYPNTLYSTAGVHPHDAKSWEEDTYRSQSTHCVHTVYQRVIMPIEDQSRVVFSQCKTFYYGGASARNQEG